MEKIIERLVNASAIIVEKATWNGVIVNLVREVVSSVDPNVRNGDNLDIRHYVKLKIIPGTHHSFFWGLDILLVFFLSSLAVFFC